MALKEVDFNQPAVLKGLKALKGLVKAENSLCQTIDQVLSTLDDFDDLLLQSWEHRDGFERRLDEIVNENYKTLGAIMNNRLNDVSRLTPTSL